LIKEYIKENLRDPSSYDPISFSELDSVFSTYITTEEGRKLDDFRKMNDSRAFQLDFDIFESNEDKIMINKDSIKIYKKIAEDAEKLFNENESKYKGELVGWSVNHKYRAKNGFGALDLEEEHFFFNKDITEIIIPRIGEVQLKSR